MTTILAISFSKVKWTEFKQILVVCIGFDIALFAPYIIKNLKHFL